MGQTGRYEALGALGGDALACVSNYKDHRSKILSREGRTQQKESTAGGSVQMGTPAASYTF